MAVCTKCGCVMHDDDVENHICNDADIPKKGKPITISEKVNIAIEEQKI